jgi:predicted GNAT family N-acyltransferase
MEAAKIIRRQVKILESDAELVAQLRLLAKTEGGHMTEFGREIIASAKDNSVKQAFVAKLLAISPGAVSQHYAR